MLGTRGDIHPNRNLTIHRMDLLRPVSLARPVHLVVFVLPLALTVVPMRNVLTMMVYSYRDVLAGGDVQLGTVYGPVTVESGQGTGIAS